jgi:hypothetical protein
MKLMTKHSSASVREETPHETKTNTLLNALVRRAQAKINDKSLDSRSRVFLRYALETNDPWLAELVRRAEKGEGNFDTIDFSQSPESNVDDANEKIEALAEIICNAGDESAAALFVLMGTLEHSADASVLANAAKHFAFTHCAESNLYGMVDAQIAVVEGELLAGGLR